MKASDYTRVEKAIEYLVGNLETQPSLLDLSSYLNLSEYHCHRLFKRWAGITPKDFLQVVTLAKAKRLLRDSKSLLETSHTIGLSGTSRLHDLFVNLEAMTPGEFKKGGEGLKIYWDRFESPMGKMILGKTNRGICSLSFESKDKGLGDLRSRWPKAEFVQNRQETKEDRVEICSRMTGQAQRKVKLLIGGSYFQVRVWKALLNLPEGALTTYQGIANQIGKPKAVRAVGSAVGANPIGYLIPCHRVIKSSGAIGEYHWGTLRKTALISTECARSMVH